VITTFTILANQGLINPTPYESYCSIGSYPFDCNDRDDMEECIRGGGSNGVEQFRIVFFFTMTTALVTLATSMLLIILTLYKSDRKLKDARSMMKEHVTEDDSPCAAIMDSSESSKQGDEVHNQESQHNMTKAITTQALMYLGAFLFTWIFTVLSFCGEDLEQNSWIQGFKLVFQPLQGFFNMLIFIYYKGYNIRRADEDVSVCEALMTIFTSPSTIPAERLSCVALVYEIEFRNRFGIEENENVVFEEDASREIRERDEAIINTDVSSSREDHSYINGISFASGTFKSNAGMSTRSPVPEVDSNFEDDDLSFAASRTVHSGWSKFSGFLSK